MYIRGRGLELAVQDFELALQESEESEAEPPRQPTAGLGHTFADELIDTFAGRLVLLHQFAAEAGICHQLFSQMEEFSPANLAISAWSGLVAWLLRPLPVMALDLNFGQPV